MPLLCLTPPTEGFPRKLEGARTLQRDDRRTDDDIANVNVSSRSLKRTGLGQSKKSQSSNISPNWGEAPTVPIKTKICMVGSLRDVIIIIIILFVSDTIVHRYIQQDAQLSQRYRAAGCVIVFAKSRRWNWETIFYGHYIFNHCNISGLKICRIL